MERFQRPTCKTSGFVSSTAQLGLINAGVSAETLKVVMRHRDFTTTEKYYAATRAAQSAAAEIYERLASKSNNNQQKATTEVISQLSTKELKKLKALLDSI